MKRSALSLFLFPLLLVAVLAFPALAQAADTWLPVNEFNANKESYLDPRLKNHPNFPVVLAGDLDSKLEAQEKAHGLKFYVVVTEQGTETNPTSQKFAVWKLDEFVARIQPKLAQDDYVIILVVRSNSDPSKVSYAAQGGNKLQQYGMDGSYFSSQSGPLNSNRSFVPQDPSGFAVAVAKAVNGQIDWSIDNAKRIEEQRKADEARRIEDARKAEEQRKADELRRIEEEKQRAIDAERARLEHEAFMKALPGNLLKFGVPGLILLLLLLRLGQFMVLRGRLKKSEAEWTELFNNANTNFLQMREEYFTFLQAQGTDWSKKFKGKTLTTYTAAVKQFSDLSARMEIALKRLTEARKGLATKNFVTGVGLVKKGIALLETEPVKVAGNELPFDMVDLFGSVVEEQTHTSPREMVKGMADLFAQANKALASIVKSFRGAKQNRDDITGLVAQIETIKGTLAEKNLAFTPYETRYAQLKAGEAAFVAIIDSDPLGAFAGSEEVETGIEELKKFIERAIALKDSLATTEGAIAKSTKKVADQRGVAVDYRYPLGGSEQKELTAGANHILSEDNGNPDTQLTDAREHLSNALKAVLEGRLDDADREKKASEAKATEASNLVDTILAAKAFVEKDVVPQRSALNKLRGDIPGATTAVTQLKAEFLEKNYTGEPGKLDNANSVADSTDAELAKIKKAYDEQRYLAARRRLEAVNTSIDHATDQLVEIHTRLAKLRQLKKHSRDTVAAALELKGQLKSKLTTNAFTTSAQTDNTYGSLIPQCTNQKADVDKDITDWVAAADAADKLLANLRAVDKAIDNEKAAHANAEASIRTLASTISDAASYVRDSDTRQPAKSKYSEAQSALSTVENLIRQAKSDWASIARRANDSTGLAGQAKSLAQADKQAANAARSAISSARSNISGTTSSYSGEGRTFHTDLSSANSYLGQAERALGSGDYEGASRLAASASSAADSAESSARRQRDSHVAAVVAERERIAREKREREERERREQEARERREREEREERNRRNNDSGFGGSGRSGGGSSSSNRSGGGGDF